MAIPVELFRFRVARNNQEQRPQGERLGIAQRQRVARQSNQLLPDDWTEQLGADEWSALKLNLAAAWRAHSLAGLDLVRVRTGGQQCPFQLAGHYREVLTAPHSTLRSWCSMHSP